MSPYPRMLKAALLRVHLLVIDLFPAGTIPREGAVPLCKLSSLPT